MTDKTVKRVVFIKDLVTLLAVVLMAVFAFGQGSGNRDRDVRANTDSIGQVRQDVDELSDEFGLMKDRMNVGFGEVNGKLSEILTNIQYLRGDYKERGE